MFGQVAALPFIHSGERGHVAPIISLDIKQCNKKPIHAEHTEDLGRHSEQSERSNVTFYLDLKL